MKGKLPSRLFLLIIIGLFASFQTVCANPITRQQALENANEFLQKRGINVKNVTMRQVPAFKGSMASENAPYYVFNIGDGNGFVIASGDDCAYEILGYADEGSYDADNMPDGMKYLLDSYAEQISTGTKNPNAGKPKLTTSYPAVETLLTTKWGQRDPYNANCPMYGSTDQRCVTGCVATAMAQVMYYHRNHSTREVVKSIPAYYLPGGMRVEGITKGSPIDWDNMLDTYDSNATEVQRQAVANLMLYCGVSVEMQYGLSSGAHDSDVPRAMINYFDYADDMMLRDRVNYTNTEWETMVYEDLGKGLPIFYAGGSHAYIIDGHDGNGYVHINWGWNGGSNGNFRLTATYSGEPVMGGYTSGQSAIFGAAPNGFFPRLTTTALSLTSSDVVENLSSITSIPVSLEMTVTNLTEETGTFEQAVGLYKLGQLEAVVSPVSTFEELAPGASRNLSVALELASTLTPGAYTLVPVSRPSGSDKWRINGNPDKFVTMSIYANAAHLTEGTPDQEGDIITFACDQVRDICVQYWDLNGDGALSKEEAAAVTNFDRHFWNKETITSFDELQYFTGLTKLDICEFMYCSDLESVILPPNLQSIESRAFYECHSLQHVTIPKTVTSIGNEVFYGTRQLKEVSVEIGNPVYDSRNDCNALIETATNKLIAGGSRSVIPDDVVTIGAYAFTSCKGLESIQIPESVTSIEDYAFAYCSNMTSIIIPESVTTMGNAVFASCSALTEITIPSSVTSMGTSVFSNCTGLTSVNFLANVTSISNSTFNGCESLASFTIPNHVTSIGTSAFNDCTGLTAITIPSSVTQIGSGAFKGCSGLTSVMIPSSVTSIDGNPFSSCPNLQSIVVEAGNPRYESDGNNSAIIETATKTLVTGCARTVIPEGIKIIGRSAFYGCSGLTSIDIPEGVTTIGSYAFYQCKDLTTVSLPNSLTSIEERAFTWCTNLTAAAIPAGVTIIGESAFSLCEKLESVNIPAGVAKISSEAFYKCESLTSVNISYGVKVIAGNAFYSCKRLKFINLPSTITTVGNYAFQSCTGLRSIKCYIKNVFNTGKNPFTNCNNATLYVPQGLVEVYQSTPDWNKLTFIEEMTMNPDVDGDGSANINDVVRLISKILDSSSDEDYSFDVNNDEQINISDVVTLINIIMTM